MKKARNGPFTRGHVRSVTLICHIYLTKCLLPLRNNLFIFFLKISSVTEIFDHSHEVLNTLERICSVKPKTFSKTTNKPLPKYEDKKVRVQLKTFSPPLLS